MKAKIVRFVVSVLATVLARVGPEMVNEAIKEIQTRYPSLKDSMSKAEFHWLLFRSTGYMTVSALVVGVTSGFMIPEADYFKDGAIAGLGWMVLAVIVGGTKQIRQGPDLKAEDMEMVASRPAVLPVTTSAMTTEQATELLAYHVQGCPEATDLLKQHGYDLGPTMPDLCACAPNQCKFSGKIVEPPAPVQA